MIPVPHTPPTTTESQAPPRRNPPPLPSTTVRTPLHTIEDHVANLLGRVRPTPPQELTVEEAAESGTGLILATPVLAATPVPPFDHAAVDGYAVHDGYPSFDPARVEGYAVRDGYPSFDPARVEGYAVRDGYPSSCAEGAQRPQSQDPGLRSTHVVGGVQAGGHPAPPLSPGEAVRIMTGAPIPPGTSYVVPVEATSTAAFTPGKNATETSVTFTPPHRTNIRRQGEDLTAGTVLAKPGDPVTPALIAAAAAAGVTAFTTHGRPRVAVLSTGSELAPSGTLADRPGAITDSNSLMLAAIARTAGADVLRRGGIPDDAGSLRAALDAVVAEGADLIVTTGGVSAGAWDVVRQVLLQGAPATDVDLTGVEMRPGRPQGLAAWRGVPWVALPGTPTAAFTAAHLFVVPAIDRLRGSTSPGLPRVTAEITLDDDCDRTRVLPVTAADGEASPLATRGHALAALLQADALAIVPPGGPGRRPVDALLLRGHP